MLEFLPTVAISFSSLSDFEQDVVGGFFTVAAFLSWMALYYSLSKKRQQTAKGNFERLVARLGLQVGPLPKEIKWPNNGWDCWFAKGKFRGRTAELGSFMPPRPSGNGGSMGIEINNPKDFVFTVAQNRSAYFRLGNGERVVTGDLVFDEAFTITSSDIACARMVFSAQIREGLLQARMQRPLGVIEIKNQNGLSSKFISYFEPSVFYNPKAPQRYIEFGEMLGLLCAIAEKIEQTT